MNHVQWWYIANLTKQVKLPSVAIPDKKKRGRPPKIKDIDQSIPLGVINEDIPSDLRGKGQSRAKRR
jgi:hypothetical protein